MRVNLAIVLATCLALAGCATEPVSTADARPVPADRIHSAAYSKQAPDSGTVLIKRDSGMMAAACAVQVFINGSLIAELRTSEMLVLYMPPGEHIAGTRSSGICYSGNSEAPIVVKPRETRAYRLSIDAGGTSRIGPTAF